MTNPKYEWSADDGPSNPDLFIVSSFAELADFSEQRGNSDQNAAVALLSLVTPDAATST
jgi:hypothetical protein